MNYGFTPRNGELPLELLPQDEANRLFIQLYDYAASQIPIEGLKVLEVGSGRGGGASFVTRYHHPSEMIGLDYSQSAIELSRRLHKDVPNLQFIQGDAESLQFEDHTFDVVINVESSHCYGNVDAFIKEVSRVLKPGGYFSWVDLRSKEMFAETESAFNIHDFSPIHSETITKEVVQALDEIHERKMSMIADNVPKVFQTAFRDFAGVKILRSTMRFKKGRLYIWPRHSKKSPYKTLKHYTIYVPH
jgi:ubiquinone/menaquinone biosynthesis C-methylase UbiE